MFKRTHLSHGGVPPEEPSSHRILIWWHGSHARARFCILRSRFGRRCDCGWVSSGVHRPAAKTGQMKISSIYIAGMDPQTPFSTRDMVIQLDGAVLVSTYAWRLPLVQNASVLLLNRSNGQAGAKTHDLASTATRRSGPSIFNA